MQHALSMAVPACSTTRRLIKAALTRCFFFNVLRGSYKGLSRPQSRFVTDACMHWSGDDRDPFDNVLERTEGGRGVAHRPFRR